MKTLKLIALAAFALVFSQCKTTTPTGPAAPTASVGEVGQTLLNIEAQLLLYGDSTNGNVRASFQRTGNWLKSQPDIRSSAVLDSSYIYFTLQSGLTGMYYLDEVDDSGISVTRGGKGGGGDLYRWDPLSVNTITTTSVLIFAPVFNEFYTVAEFQGELNTLNNSGLGLNVTVVKGLQCTANIVNQFGNYGLVIIDTHGAPNGFLIGSVLPDTLLSDEVRTKLLINVNLGNTAYDMFQAGQLMLARGLTITALKPLPKKVPSNYNFAVILTSNYVTGLPKLSGTVVFGNMCYSGQSQPVPATMGIPTPIQAAFASLNPISYYGYSYASGNSASVSNLFAKQMEDSLIKQLITNTDSTGHCYLQQDGTEYYDVPGLGTFSTEKLFFKHFGPINYSYMKCGDTLVDARDGQKYTTTCIGKQKWMAQNLNYNAAGSFFYNNDPANGAIYGRLYDWATLMQGAASSTASPSGVQGVCPKGWHIPSNAEYVTMAGSLGGTTVAGGAMKAMSSLWNSPNTGATNSSGFSGLPGGNASDGPPVTFVGLGDAAQFATSQLTTNGKNAVIWFLNSGDGTTGETASQQTNANSCRCVKDP